jgi:hypothetical protein
VSTELDVQLTNGLKEFRRTLCLARQDDPGAIRNLPGIAEELICLALRSDLSAPSFAEVARELQAGLSEIRKAQACRR